MDETIHINGQETNREELADMIERYSLVDIGKEFGVGPNRIAAIYDLHEIPRRTREWKKTESYDKAKATFGEAILAEWKKGYAPNTIRLRLGVYVKAENIERILKEMGVTEDEILSRERKKRGAKK